MKRVFSILMLFALTAVTSCSTDDIATESFETVSFENSLFYYNPNGESMEYQTFESDIWGTPCSYSDVFTGIDYTTTTEVASYYDSTVTVESEIFNGLLLSYKGSSKISFGSYYSDCMEYGYKSDTFGGFVLSKNYSSEGTTDYSKQFNVLAESGANGSAAFLSAYYSSWTGSTYEYAIPTVELSTPRTLRSICFANSPLLVGYAPTKSVSVTVNGYKSDSLIGSQDVELIGADGSVAFTEWLEVEFNWTSSVDKIQFIVKCEDEYAPTYFCVDEFIFVM